MSDFVLDASVALQWLLEDEVGREYSLAIVSRLAEERALVPMLWCYEVTSGLLMAHRRKRITFDQVRGFLQRLRTFPIDVVPQTQTEIFGLADVAFSYGLTSYDATYLAFAIHFNLPLATADAALRRAAEQAGVAVIGPRDSRH